MNNKILQKASQSFIDENLNSDITKLILKGSPFDGITIQELSNQIIAKQKSKNKLPTWFKTSDIYYPAKISIEQTSSEITANYKATLLNNIFADIGTKNKPKNSPKSLLDITGGFGVDAYFFSKIFTQVIHAEINENLSEIVAYNYQKLGVKNIQTVAVNGLDYLKNSTQKFDCIYIDPSRRDEVKGKVFLLKDCLPNVPENLDFLFTKSPTILIKNSPMLDISATLNSLKHVKEIHVIAVNNEVKELLFLLQKNTKSIVEIHTVNLLTYKTQTLSFTLDKKDTKPYINPINFLYEPNTAILKSGGFNEVSNSYEVGKIAQHSHLYTSEKIVENFPGRTFKIEAIYPYQKKKIKRILSLLKLEKANITTRNFPKTVAQIRTETKLKDGGNTYLFFTTNSKDELLIINCSKIA
ncbi:class I SAM-dependent methyltransferase [Tenacibaculum piscium]|uniref:THUMP-like domain-containing protein n=1 Tax=Tenacibaculum piscium TaxID=1458515 RepID=UPI00187B7757|nr:class I SAM-dependent methyltransferase [Tenacibaculum piscium]MBE7686073.1 class I SAM-dependent methyltransferase [Tenacibaculum piscium]